jgi:hypothetical protein
MTLFWEKQKLEALSLPHCFGRKLRRKRESVGVKFSTLVLVAVASTFVSGCSSVSGLLGGNDRPGPAAQQQIAVNNELALPPDLSLATPGTRAPASRAAAVDDFEAPVDNAPLATTPRPAAPARAPAQDVYDQYGISKLNPDGTKKDDGKLREELRQAVLAKKRKQNPNHGTIFNIGELFSDQ